MKIEKFQLCFTICFDTTKRSHAFFSYSIRNYNAMTSEIRTKDIMRRKILGEIFKGFFCYCRDSNMSWQEHFPRFNKPGVWNKKALGVKFSKN